MKPSSFIRLFTLIAIIPVLSTAQPIVFKADFPYEIVAIVDIDGDNIPELIINNGTSDTTYSFYDGKTLALKTTTRGMIPYYSFDAPNPFMRYPNVDYDGDGKREVIFRAPGKTFIVNVSTGSIIFTGPPGAVHLTDLDNDGTLDLIIRSETYPSTGAKIYSTNVSVTSVSNDPPSKSPAFDIKQNYPNPFNPSTNIEYEVQAQAHIIIKVYDMLGRAIRTLVDSEQSPGSYSIPWNGKTSDGLTVPTGTYFYQLQAGDFTSAKKMLMIR